MKTSVVLAVGILGLTCLSGCSAGNQSVEARRDFAIRLNTVKSASITNVVQSKWTSDILSALRSANTKSINKPQIASAVLVGRKNGTYGLFVFWIENYPSADGVELRLSKETSPIKIATPETELKQIQAEAKDTIVYGSEYGWDKTSELCKSLEQTTSTKGLELRLLRADKPVTDWFQVKFYKVDKWLSSDLNP